MVTGLTYYRRKYLEEALESPLSQGDGDSLSNDLFIEAGENNLILRVTRQQYYELLSASLNGAYTTFPEKFNEVIYPLIKAGKLSFCDEVLNCIQTNQSVSDAIRQASGSQFYDVNQGEQPEILGTDLLDGQASVDCNNDNLFGATTQLTDLLNTISADVLELFETAFATPSRLGDVIEAIPGVGELPVDDALQALEKFSQQVKSAYDAAYDTQLRDDFRCELFCLAQENCTLTIEQARDYFKDKITVDVSTAQSFLTLITDILVNNWLGLQSVYMMHWFILDAIIFGTEILGIDVNRLQNQIAIFWNDPDSDWGILCDPCPSPQSCDDVDPQFTPLASGRGSYVNSEWIAGNYIDGAGQYRGIDIDYNPAGANNGQYFLKIDYEYVRGSFNTDIAAFLVRYGVTDVALKTFSQMVDGTFSEYYELPTTDPNENIRVLIRSSRGSYTGNVTITDIELCDRLP